MRSKIQTSFEISDYKLTHFILSLPNIYKHGDHHGCRIITSLTLFSFTLNIISSSLTLSNILFNPLYIYSSLMSPYWPIYSISCCSVFLLVIWFPLTCSVSDALMVPFSPEQIPSFLISPFTAISYPFQNYLTKLGSLWYTYTHTVHHYLPDILPFSIYTVILSSRLIYPLFLHPFSV